MLPFRTHFARQGGIWGVEWSTKPSAPTSTAHAQCTLFCRGNMPSLTPNMEYFCRGIPRGHMAPGHALSRKVLQLLRFLFVSFARVCTNAGPVQPLDFSWTRPHADQISARVLSGEGFEVSCSRGSGNRSLGMTDGAWKVGWSCLRINFARV